MIAHAYYLRGNALCPEGAFGKGFAHFSEAIRLDPAAPEGYRNRGLTWYYMKQYDEAIGDFSNVIRLSPHQLVLTTAGALRGSRRKSTTRQLPTFYNAPGSLLTMRVPTAFWLCVVC